MAAPLASCFRRCEGLTVAVYGQANIWFHYFLASDRLLVNRNFVFYCDFFTVDGNTQKKNFFFLEVTWCNTEPLVDNVMIRSYMDINMDCKNICKLNLALSVTFRSAITTIEQYVIKNHQVTF